MQHRRHADRLADLAQALAGLVHASGVSRPYLAPPMAAQPVLDHQHVVGDEFLHQLMMRLVLGHTGVVAADDAGDAADAALR